MIHIKNDDQSWRKYQTKNFRQEKVEKSFVRRLRLLSSILALTLLVSITFLLNIDTPHESLLLHTGEDHAQKTNSSYTENEDSGISKSLLFTLLSGKNLAKETSNVFTVNTGEKEYKIYTSIDMKLQDYLHSLQNRAKKFNWSKPRLIAFVIMDPYTGKIIAMSGYDDDKPNINPCLKSDYPAASIFKVVTAAAAVETLGYEPYTPLYFVGNKYTLYKRQLREIKNKKNAYRISF